MQVRSSKYLLLPKNQNHFHLLENNDNAKPWLSPNHHISSATATTTTTTTLLLWTQGVDILYWLESSEPDASVGGLRTWPAACRHHLQLPTLPFLGDSSPRTPPFSMRGGILNVI